MKLFRPRPFADYAPTGLTRWVHLAERAVAALERMDGDIEIRLGEPSFRCGVPASVVRDALQRHIDEAHASPAWGMLR